MDKIETGSPPTAAAPVEAYQKAPTLMSGYEVGIHGEVRVWSPDLSLVRRQAREGVVAAVGYFGLPFVLMPFIQMGVSGHLPSWLIDLFIFLFLPVYTAIGIWWVSRSGALSASRRPRYLTSDDAGIGVTTARGTRYLLWDEVSSALYSQVDSRIVLTTIGRERVPLNLVGFPRVGQRALLRVIRERAKLQPAGRGPMQVLVRPDYRYSPITGRLTPVLPGKPAVGAIVTGEERTLKPGPQ